MIAEMQCGTPTAIHAEYEETAPELPGVAEVLPGLAEQLLAHTDDIAAEITRRAVAAEPGLVDPDDPTSFAAAERSTRDNVGAILAMFAYGISPHAASPPRGAMHLFERLADRDDGLRVMLRGYRLGMRELWQVWGAFSASQIDDARLLHAVLAVSTGRLHTYVDGVCDQLASDWHDVRRRRRQGARLSVEHVVRHALLGKDREGEELATLHYPAEATHVALALPAELEPATVESLARRLQDWAGARMLTARIDDSPIIWLAFGDVPTARQVQAIERVLGDEFPVGMSDGAPGTSGFRTARREGLDALRIATLRGRPGVTRYRDVALVAVLCADPERAGAFARTELGPLAANDEVAERLRETLTTYLACGESHVAAAQFLYVHQKTVAYRVRQAEGLLGRRLCERRAELEAALLVYRALDGRV